MSELSSARRLLHAAYRNAWRLRGAQRVVMRLGDRGWPVEPEFTARLWGAGRLTVPNDRVGLPFDLYCTGVYEILPTLFVRAFAPGKVFYDIGANVGYFSVLACSATAERIVSFEPFAPNRSYLERNLAANEAAQATVYACALGNAPGQLDLHAGGAFGDGSVSATTSVSEDVVATVPVECLDTLVERDGLHGPDLVKLDIEGYELHALAGMEETLERYDPVLVIELNPETLAAAGSSQAEAVAVLGRYGYAHLVDLDGRQAEPLEVGRTFNALAVSRARWTQARPILEALGYRES